MQATIDMRTVQSYNSNNNLWNAAKSANTSRSSFGSPFSSPFNSPFSSPFGSSGSFGAHNRPGIYPQQMPFGNTQPFGPYGTAQRSTSMIQYQREISRTPQGTTMKTSYTSFQQSGPKGFNNVPDHYHNDFRKGTRHDSDDRNRVAPVVSQNGNKLNVDIGNTHSELSKDKATTKMKVGGNDVEFTGWGDPHGIIKVNGKESKADFSKPLSLDTKDMRVTMDPETKQSSDSAPPHMNRVIYEPKGSQQVFVGEHLSPSDKAKVSFREVTDNGEIAQMRNTANTAQKAVPKDDKIIDQKTGQQVV
ncbi:hypothetical protein [Paraburkholderia sp. SOS3]|jgi:hypothetical protein|uniref:hypothetical protein n=1 Tax=Paraburkholderia sp. SOS3 TaxID=1926494 RepID=UPI000947772D|nr:hypothetical protein [Paraburkholderia sp. SOS3]APR34403.1 hypothetical protein BTO02_02130 [Paraburkholderia sp. SOS3]